MSNYRHFTINVPIYTGVFHIFVYNSREALIEKFPEEKNTNAWCYKDGVYNYCMVLHKETLLSSLVHESVHIVNYIFEYHGVKLDTKNDETQAYFTTWVFEQCELVLKKC